MSNAFAPLQQARPCPTLGRPVRLRVAPNRLRPGSSPHALRILSHDRHPALQKHCNRVASAPPWLVSGFRLRARLGCSIPSPLFRPARNYPRFWISRSSSERERDFNPPEQYAAQRTIGFIHSPGPIRIAEMAPHSLVENRSIRENPTSNGGMIDAQTTFRHHLFQIAITE